MKAKRVLNCKLAIKIYAMNANKSFTSAISNIEFPESERVLGKAIRISVLRLIQEDYPNFDSNNSIAISELNVYREKYISKYLQTEIRELSDLEKNVVTKQVSTPMGIATAIKEVPKEHVEIFKQTEYYKTLCNIVEKLQPIAEIISECDEYKDLSKTFK